MPDEVKISWPDAPLPMQYEVLCCETFEAQAKQLEKRQPNYFRYHQSSWKKFSDSNQDNIELGGFNPENLIRNRHVLFLASFANNDITMQQLSAFVVLLQSHIKSLTILLPFYPVATNERVLREGKIATANTVAQLLNGLPSCGRPVRLIIYDLHTLQNRFYWSGSCVANLYSAIPLLLEYIAEQTEGEYCIAFPDDGAQKRFGPFFKNFHKVTCAKKRIPNSNQRKVTIMDGDPANKPCIIIDDLVRSGNTLLECANVLREGKATNVSCFVTHSVFAHQSWRNFITGPKAAWVHKFITTQSVPEVVNEIMADEEASRKFVVLDLTQQYIKDIHHG